MRVHMTVVVLVTLLLTGCSHPPVLVTFGEKGLPGQIGFRQLYRTPRAYVYASGEATARWASRYLEHHLKDAENRCGVRLGRGMAVVLGPGESLASARPGSQEPHLPMKPAVDLTDADTYLLFGLPAQSNKTYSWCCVLPTDDFLKEAVSRYFRNGDRKYPNGYFLDDNVITRLLYRGLMRPLYASRYVSYGRDQRKHVLSQAAVAHSAIDGDKRARALAVVQCVYKRQQEKSKEALEGFD
jgi:hypothetical protein